MVRNHVYFKFAQGSQFAGAFLRIPILCRFQAGLPGIPVLPDPDDDEDDHEPLERITDENDLDYDEEEPITASEVNPWDP